MSVKIDVARFYRRAEALYAAWKASGKDGAFKGVDAIALPAGVDSVMYQKTSTLQLWLFGYEFARTILVFTADAVTVLASESKVKVLQQLQSDAHSKPRVSILVLAKEDNAGNFAKLEEAIRGSHEGKTVGIFDKDSVEGPLADQWAAHIQGKFETVDVGGFVSELLAVKEAEELDAIRSAAKASAAFMKRVFVPRMEEIVDENKKVTHADLTKYLLKVQEDMLDKKTQSKHPKLAAVEVDWADTEWCYDPFVQSGGKYALKAIATSDNETVHPKVIIASLGIRYTDFCSNVARTFFMDPSEQQKDTYKILLEARAAAIAALRPGNKISDVYAAAVAAVEAKKPDLVARLTKTAGFGIGMLFRETSQLIDSKNDRPVRGGMCFNLALGFEGLERPDARDERGKKYAMYVADTVIVELQPVRQPNGQEQLQTVATAGASLNTDYIIEDGGDAAEASGAADEQQVTRGRREAATRAAMAVADNDVNAEEAQRRHEEQIRQKNEEARRRIVGGGAGAGGKAIAAAAVAYKNPMAVPQNADVREQRPFVDVGAKALVLPIFGHMVPFHISMVKSVTKADDGKGATLRVVFTTPGSEKGPAEMTGTNIYVRELTVRGSDPRHYAAVEEGFKEALKSYRAAENEKKEQADLVTQPALILSRARREEIPRLNELMVRPNLGRGKVSGSLEAHVNGFRFTTTKGERLDIIYANIRHAIFQPCEKEERVLVHFHLYNPILVEKKKHKDITFMQEVVGYDETDNRRRRNYGDRDELEAEKQDRLKRQKINRTFKEFCEQVQRLTERDKNPHGADLKFDMPFRDLAFNGVPNKSNVTLLPTAFCLVSLMEPPPFLVSLEDIELVYFERVQLSLKSFDMVIIYKDYARPVTTITSIPMDRLEGPDGLKQWLNETDIRFEEGPVNLNWPKIMKMINKDPADFFDRGGWDIRYGEFWDDILQRAPEQRGTTGQADSDGDSEMEEYQSSDGEFHAESSEDEEEEESSDDYEDEDEEESSEFEEEEEEEEGKSWDELEREAMEADRRQFGDEDRKRGRDDDDDDDDDDDRPRKKSKAAPPKKSSAPAKGKSGGRR